MSYDLPGGADMDPPLSLSEGDLMHWTSLMKGHRGLCSVVDYLVDRETRRDVIDVYLVSQAYNANMNDLYLTQRNEKMEFSEDHIVGIAYQVLKALEYLNRKGVNLRSMLRMENIMFDKKVRILA
jgi:serine/threonine protein kinase